MKFFDLFLLIEGFVWLFGCLKWEWYLFNYIGLEAESPEDGFYTIFMFTHTNVDELSTREESSWCRLRTYSTKKDITLIGPYV